MRARFGSFKGVKRAFNYARERRCGLGRLPPFYLLSSLLARFGSLRYFIKIPSEVSTEADGPGWAQVATWNYCSNLDKFNMIDRDQ